MRFFFVKKAIQNTYALSYATLFTYLTFCGVCIFSFSVVIFAEVFGQGYAETITSISSSSKSQILKQNIKYCDHHHFFCIKLARESRVVVTC